jgi:hypothetical protein
VALDVAGFGRRGAIGKSETDSLPGLDISHPFPVCREMVIELGHKRRNLRATLHDRVGQLELLQGAEAIADFAVAISFSELGLRSANSPSSNPMAI